MFLHTHAQQIWACDFLPVTDLFFRSLFAFFIIELHSRKVIHVGVTHALLPTLGPHSSFGKPPPMERVRSISFGITIASLGWASRGLRKQVTSRFSKHRITLRERMPSVNAFWAVCVVNASTTYSSSRKSSSTAYSRRMSSTLTKPDRIKV